MDLNGEQQLWRQLLKLISTFQRSSLSQLEWSLSCNVSWVTNVSLDAKGRIKLPKRHSETILEVSSGEVVLSIHPEDSCLLLYTIPEWLQIEEKVNRLPSLNPYTKRIRRKLIGHATE